MKTEIGFFDGYAIADCAARIFAEWHTSKHPSEDSAKVRMILREQAVRSLRFLWRTGDASQRSTVAARVAVWLRRPQNCDKIREREMKRANN